jgi:hypothetical protein
MSESFKWSFSADRCLRRCQRQFFLQHVAAWHNTRDPVRREAFLLKQVKTLELWQGSLVHRGIELYVVPQLQQNTGVDWNQVVQQTITMARRQFVFSAERRYREAGMSKTRAGDDYCALRGHETEEGVSTADFDAVVQVVRRSLTNLSEMTELWAEMRGRGKYWPELGVRVNYDAAHIEAHIDLLFFRGYGKPTIIDWKISESIGGGDADLQTALYAWALCQHPKWGVTRAEDCELLEVQLLSKTVLRHRADQVVFDHLEDRIYRSLNSMQALGIGGKYDLANIGRYDFATNPNTCAYCPLRTLCQELAAQSAIEPEPAGATGIITWSTKEQPNGWTCAQLF